MKEEALKLADELDMLFPSGLALIGTQASTMIRRLVEKLDKQNKIIQEGIQILGKTQEGLLKQKLFATETKPLSDEEIISMFDHPDDFNCIDFARAIEERHGIK